MKNFIDFVVDSTDNTSLENELTDIVETGNHEAISNWFKEKGYTVSKEECEKMTKPILS